MKPQDLIEKMYSAEPVVVEGECWLVMRVDTDTSYTISDGKILGGNITADVELSVPYGRKSAEARLTSGGDLRIHMYHEEVGI